MKNQVRANTPTSTRFALCPTTVLAGDPVLIGAVPAVALDNYQSNLGGAVFYTGGSYSLSVVAGTVVSPISGSTVNPGDKIYATGTLDSTTNVTTGLTLSKASGGTPFGVADPSATALTSGSTGNIDVAIGNQGVQ